jgi:hypothetical protein
VGAAAAFAVLTRPVLDRDVLLAYQDVPFAALIVGAVLLEATRPRRGWPVLAVLALAGLMRPEAWLLAGLYFVWMWPALAPRQRAWMAALVALSPVLWALVDVVVTGDPLHSLHGTSALAEEVNRRRTVGEVPHWTLTYFAYTLREPVSLAIPVGLLFALRHFRRRALLPLAVAVVMTLVFAIGPVFGLPLVARYIRTPAVLLTLFFGLALFGWIGLPRGRERIAWGLAALVCLGLFAYFTPKTASMLDGLRLRSSREGRFYAGLRSVGESPRVRSAFAACGPLSTSDHRPIPYVRWWLDGDPGSVGTVENGSSPLGRLLLVPRRTRLTRRFYGVNFPRYAPPAWFRTLYQNRNWRVYATPGC